MMLLLIFVSLYCVGQATDVAITPTIPTTSSSPSKPLVLRKIDIHSTENPYRVAVKEPLRLNPTLHLRSAFHSHAIKTRQQALTQTLTNSGISANNDKNWLMTKAWLIDNINRLRRELSELERDYSQHLDTMDRTNLEKEKQLVDDITKLRADHTVLSQQQKQIIYLMKKNQLFKSKSSNLVQNSLKFKSSKMADSPVKRAIKRDLTSVTSESFEAETRRNMKETFGELSALHDITLMLLNNVRSLERRVEGGPSGGSAH